MAWKCNIRENDKVDQPGRVAKENWTERLRLKGTKRNQFYKEWSRECPKQWRAGERRLPHTLTQGYREWPPHVWKLPSMTIFWLVFFNSSRCCFCLPSARAEAGQVSRNMGSAIFSDATEASGHQLTTHSSEIKTLKTITVSASSNLQSTRPRAETKWKELLWRNNWRLGIECQGSNLNSAMPLFFFFFFNVGKLLPLLRNYSFLPWRIKTLEVEKTFEIQWYSSLSRKPGVYQFPTSISSNPLYLTAVAHKPALS